MLYGERRIQKDDTNVFLAQESGKFNGKCWSCGVHPVRRCRNNCQRPECRTKPSHSGAECLVRGPSRSANNNRSTTSQRGRERNVYPSSGNRGGRAQRGNNQRRGAQGRNDGYVPRAALSELDETVPGADYDNNLGENEPDFEDAWAGLALASSGCSSTQTEQNEGPKPRPASGLYGWSKTQAYDDETDETDEEYFGDYYGYHRNELPDDADDELNESDIDHSAGGNRVDIDNDVKTLDGEGPLAGMYRHVYMDESEVMPYYDGIASDLSYAFDPSIKLCVSMDYFDGPVVDMPGVAYDSLDASRRPCKSRVTLRGARLTDEVDMELEPGQDEQQEPVVGDVLHMPLCHCILINGACAFAVCALRIQDLQSVFYLSGELSEHSDGAGDDNGDGQSFGDDTDTEGDDRMSQDSDDERPLRTANSGRGTDPTGRQMSDEAVICMAFEPAAMGEIDSLLREPDEPEAMQDENPSLAAAGVPPVEKKMGRLDIPDASAEVVGVIRERGPAGATVVEMPPRYQERELQSVYRRLAGFRTYELRSQRHTIQQAPPETDERVAYKPSTVATSFSATLVDCALLKAVQEAVKLTKGMQVTQSEAQSSDQSEPGGKQSKPVTDSTNKKNVNKKLSFDQSSDQSDSDELLRLELKRARKRQKKKLKKAKMRIILLSSWDSSDSENESYLPHLSGHRSRGGGPSSRHDFLEYALACRAMGRS
eukprot:g25232.t1